MADGVSIKFDIPAFSAQLRAFGADLERKTVRSATAAAAGVFKKLAIGRAPTLRRATKGRVAGTLRKAMYIARSKDSTRGREHYVVSFRKGQKAAKSGRDAWYGRFLESGWVPRGPGRGLKGGRRSKALQRSRSTGRKITAYQFLRPAFDAGKMQALKAFTTRIEQRLAKENAKR